VPTLTSFSFDAIASPQSSGTAFAVTITAVDQQGNVVTSYAGQPVLSDTTGTVSPAGTGSFTSGVWQGNLTISQIASGVTITATDGATTGTSNAFNVVGLDTVFSCSSPSNQAPVLTTSTDPSDLNNLGQWTQFLWLGARPFPIVAANAGGMQYGLPVMQFYTTGLTNGNYEVYATLYTDMPGRDMVYYYGYTADNPLELSVNTTGGEGNDDQVYEYDLGPISIVDGSFNIYVQDAELLPSATTTYPIFAWDSIRLSPR
jgi:hypothetical protein